MPSGVAFRKVWPTVGYRCSSQGAPLAFSLASRAFTAAGSLKPAMASSAPKCPRTGTVSVAGSASWAGGMLWTGARNVRGRAHGGGQRPGAALAEAGDAHRLLPSAFRKAAAPAILYPPLRRASPGRT
jgi:hypothetical protein